MQGISRREFLGIASIFAVAYSSGCVGLTTIIPPPIKKNEEQEFSAPSLFNDDFLEVYAKYPLEDGKVAIVENLKAGNIMVVGYGPVTNDNWFYRTAVIDSKLANHLAEQAGTHIGELVNQSCFSSTPEAKKRISNWEKANPKLRESLIGKLKPSVDLTVPPDDPKGYALLEYFSRVLNHEKVIPSVSENLEYDPDRYSLMIEDKVINSNIIDRSDYLTALKQAYNNSQRDDELMLTLGSRILDLIELGRVSPSKVEDRMGVYFLPFDIEKSKKGVGNYNLGNGIVKLTSLLNVPSRDTFRSPSGRDTISVEIPDLEFEELLDSTTYKSGYRADKQGTLKTIQNDISLRDKKNPDYARFMNNLFRYALALGFMPEIEKMKRGINDHNEYELLLGGSSSPISDGVLGKNTKLTYQLKK